MFRFRTAALVALLGSLIAATVPAGAADSMGGMNMGSGKARFSNAAIYGGAPNLPLTVALVAAGGGASKFDSVTLVGDLAGPLTSAEVKSLSDKYGPEGVKSFLEVFNFVINDSLKIATEKNVPIPSKPAVDPKDGKALSGALYTAGILPSTGKFDVEYMLDNLVSHPIHLQVMDDIDAKYGRKADANYHVVLTQAMNDLKAAYKL